MNASRARPTAEARTKYHTQLSEIWMPASSSVAGRTGVPSGTNCGSSAM